MSIFVMSVCWPCLQVHTSSTYDNIYLVGAQWLNGRVLDSRPRFEPRWRHWVVVLEQDTFILA